MTGLPDDSPDAPKALAGLSGSVLGERYELGLMIGSGGMGAVFEATDLRLRRPVAIKVMRPVFAEHADYVQRFLREAQAASKIRHRNVVVILDYGEAAAGLVYSVMELFVGQDLEELLRRQPDQRLPWREACDLLAQIAAGLKAAHERGVIHRDVKPANCFLITEDGESVIKLVDFGIAKLVDRAQTRRLTSTGEVLGTPSYVPPEVVRTLSPATPRSDVYSLGVLAYRMLTGRLPFTGETDFEVMRSACMDPVPSLREQVPEVPSELEGLVLEMLAKQPQERPADMLLVRQRLQALSHEGLAAHAVATPVPSPVRLGGDRRGSSAEGERTAVLKDVAAVGIEKTEVLESAPLEQSDSPSMPSPPRETLPVRDDATGSDSVSIERRRRAAGGRVVAGAAVVAALGGVVWSTMDGELDEESNGGVQTIERPQAALVPPPAPPVTVADEVADEVAPPVAPSSRAIEPASPDAGIDPPARARVLALARTQGLSKPSFAAKLAPAGPRRYLAALRSRSSAGPAEYGLHLLMLHAPDPAPGAKLEWMADGALELHHWTSPWLDDAEARSIPTTLLVDDYERDGELEALVRFRHEIMCPGGGPNTITELRIIELVPTLEVALKTELHHAVVSAQTKGSVHHDDLDTDGHPDLRIRYSSTSEDQPKPKLAENAWRWVRGDDQWARHDLRTSLPTYERLGCDW